MKHVLITGGAGLVGTYLAHRLLGAGWAVLIYNIYNNFSQSEVETNPCDWLLENRQLKVLADSTLYSTL